MTTLVSASLYEDIRRIEPASLVGPLTVSLDLGLATLPGSHMPW